MPRLDIRRYICYERRWRTPLPAAQIKGARTWWGGASSSNPAFFDGGGATPRSRVRSLPFNESSNRSDSPTVGVPIDLNHVFTDSPDLQRGDVSGWQCLFGSDGEGAGYTDSHMSDRMPSDIDHGMV